MLLQPKFKVWLHSQEYISNISSDHTDPFEVLRLLTSYADQAHLQPSTSYVQSTMADNGSMIGKHICLTITIDMQSGLYVYQTCKSNCYLSMGSEAFERNAGYEQVSKSDQGL